MTKPACQDNSDCWLQFQSPEDGLRVNINGQNILSLDSEESYHSNDFFMFPVGSFHIKDIQVQAKDINQDKRFSNETCISIGKYNDVRWANSIQWFFRTGATLFSAYFLILISLFLGFSFWISRSGIGLSLLIYSIVSAIYLFSFSEYPRSMMDPVLASGGIHFPLRLLQDLCLIFVFYNIYQKNDSQNIIKKISWIYTIVIGIYLLMLIIGIKDYIFYSRVIIIMAPLVAAPMAIGTWFSFKLKDPIERKVLIPISIILFIFQLNDLFVFWKLTNGYFIVRLYIPFIVGMALFLYFRRMHVEAAKLSIFTERQKIFKEFLHDVKSPLAVLRIFLASTKENKEHYQVIQSALDRIENMVLQVDRPNKDDNLSKIKVISSLQEVLNQKVLEYPDLIINNHFNADAYIFANKAKIQRIFSNIINNAYEAYSQTSHKVVEIKVIFGSEDVRILISDKGKGIPKTLLETISKEEVSSKINGQGIGLSSADRYIKEIGGNLQIISKEGLGTTIEITLLSSMSDVVLSEIETNLTEQMESPDLILIDDDRYIRLSWKLHAQNTGRTIKTYDSLESFFLDADKIKKETPIYLDINLNGQRSLEYLSRFEKLGFANLTLASGEDIDTDHLPRTIRGIIGKLPPLH